ncbi:hypothetical protein CC78DRAFT_101813 [Lojkania enalia]|uniref:Uncharacterized protein n=1 Tax=Lojkania enalia TaxID=147567 RepID=A0A9P4N654_9PLEO|nr:hypothetical protein CC78DRAFT_101813 [Didymosphaeria enalia]
MWLSALEGAAAEEFTFQAAQLQMHHSGTTCGCRRRASCCCWPLSEKEREKSLPARNSRHRYVRGHTSILVHPWEEGKGHARVAGRRARMDGGPSSVPLHINFIDMGRSGYGGGGSHFLASHIRSRRRSERWLQSSPWAAILRACCALPPARGIVAIGGNTMSD